MKRMFVFLIACFLCFSTVTISYAAVPAFDNTQWLELPSGFGGGSHNYPQSTVVTYSDLKAIRLQVNSWLSEGQYKGFRGTASISYNGSTYFIQLVQGGIAYRLCNSSGAYTAPKANLISLLRLLAAVRMISIKRLLIIMRPVLAARLQLRLYLLLGLIVICRKRYIRALSIFISVWISLMVIFPITVGLQLIFAIRFRRMWFPPLRRSTKTLLASKIALLRTLMLCIPLRSTAILRPSPSWMY